MVVVVDELAGASLRSTLEVEFPIAETSRENEDGELLGWLWSARGFGLILAGRIRFGRPCAAVHNMNYANPNVMHVDGKKILNIHILRDWLFFCPGEDSQ